MKPKARDGLITADHTRRGRRIVTVLDPETHRVTVLEPWEHAVLVLCDGTRTAEQVAVLMPDDDEVTVDAAAVRLCFELFQREQVTTSAAPRPRSAGPRTLANLQLAYAEWHKDPVRTKQILLGEVEPFPAQPDALPPGLSPTVALPDEEPAHRVGSVLVAADISSMPTGAATPIDPSATDEMDGAPPSALYEPLPSKDAPDEDLDRTHEEDLVPPLELEDEPTFGYAQRPAEEVAPTLTEQNQPERQRRERGSLPVAPMDPEDTESITSMPNSAAAVFARLRRAGVVARSTREWKDPRGEGRRKNRATTQVFETGLELLAAGDLQFALEHFQTLLEHMPGSSRVSAFVRAIEAVRRQPAFDTAPMATPGEVARARAMLDSFEGAIAEAVQRGQCPSCFAGVSPGDEDCPRCGFVLRSEEL
ncbi:MAG: hypothetical protein RIT81_22070 [Deltaproteobacteria bacterium]